MFPVADTQPACFSQDLYSHHISMLRKLHPTTKEPTLNQVSSFLCSLQVCFLLLIHSQAVAPDALWPDSTDRTLSNHPSPASTLKYDTDNQRSFTHTPSRTLRLRNDERLKCGSLSHLRRLARPIRLLARHSHWTRLLKLAGRGVASKNIFQKVLILFTMYLPMTVCLSGPVAPVWVATGYRPSSPTKSMCSLVASTVHNDSDGEEATEPYDDEKTETDSTVSVSASSSGSFDESDVPNSEKAKLGPPSRTHSTPSPTR